MVLALFFGILIYGFLEGVLLAVILAVFARDIVLEGVISFFLGVILAGTNLFHIHNSLKTTLEYGEEKGATAHSLKGYAMRLAALALVVLIVAVCFGPLFELLALLGANVLKVAAYLQPITDKFLVSKIYS